MSYPDLRFELDDGVATLTLDRPEQRNAFSGAMGESLGRAYRRCDDDDDVRAIVLTGAGEAFCVGADLAAGADAFAPQDPDGFSATPIRPTAFEIRKPVIGALNGHAVGIGLTLALHCDMRLVARDAQYGVLQVRRGMMPDCCAHWTLPRVVGMERAAYLLLTGRKVDGDEAVSLGLALRALPHEEVLPAAQAIARDIADHAAPLSVAVTKRLLWESATLDLAQVEERETALHHHLMGGADAAEGARAWLERRAPRFRRTVGNDWPQWPLD
ncbi:MAG: crotonase [Myxococcales bacterium]|nr:crotonase [Myxococcales bacterium]